MLILTVLSARHLILNTQFSIKKAALFRVAFSYLIIFIAVSAF